MMFLNMMTIGETKRIVKINGKDDTKRFLWNLGFVEGSDVAVVSQKQVYRKGLINIERLYL